MTPDTLLLLLSLLGLITSIITHKLSSSHQPTTTTINKNTTSITTAICLSGTILSLNNNNNNNNNNTTLPFILSTTWLFIGSGQLRRLLQNRVFENNLTVILFARPLLELMDDILGPGVSVLSRYTALLVPGFISWVLVPLSKGWTSTNTCIAGAAVAMVLGAVIWMSDW